MKKKFLVVGFGSIGKRHARLLAEREDLEMEFVEPNPENLGSIIKEIGNRPTYGSLEEGLQNKPDTVLIATPHFLHAEQTVKALEAGADVLCEKPMCVNMAEAEKMKATAEKTGKILDIGFSLRFNPCLKKLKDIVTSGTLGNILHLHARVGTYATLVNSISRHQFETEGSLFMDYVHQPDIFYWISGEEPEYLYTSASQIGKLELTSNPNLVMINCEYNSGLLASIHLNYIQEPGRHEYEIIGDEGWCHLDVARDKGTFIIGDRKTSNIKNETIEYNWDDVYRNEHQDFIGAVNGDNPPGSSPESGIVSVAFCDASIKSWKEKKRVRV